VSIGPVTSAALRDAGLVVAAEAETASLDALVEACEGLF
jgi:uroporphyrinogen-III synthase